MNLEKLRIKTEPHSPSPGGVRKVLIAGFACFVAGLVVGLFVNQGSGKAVLSVKTYVVRAGGGEASKSFSAGGWIEVAAPEYPLVVAARISQRLESLLVKQGDVVTPGQLLARLYDVDLRSRLDLAEARSMEAAERRRVAKADYDRSSRLAAGAISAEELDRDLAAYKTAEQAAAAISAERDIAKRELDYCSVSVPAGVPSLKVLDIYHLPGSWVGSGKDAAILSLYDPSNIQVRVDVPQTNIRHVRAGGQVEVRTEANPMQAYKGVVLRMDPMAELAKNTVRVRIKVENPDEMLFPEMIAHVNFLQVQQDAGSDAPKMLMVPASAVMKKDEKSSVFIVEDGVARLRSVELAEENGLMFVVKSGLKGGQRVVVSGTENLSDGQRVEAD